MLGTCPICVGSDFEFKGDYRGAHPVFLGMKRAHCKTCEMVFADPMPSDSAMSEFNASYFNNAHGGKPQGAATLAFFSGIARLRAAHLEHYLRQNEISVSKVHEVGPGPGWFARSWMAQHPRTTYSAIETDASCHVVLREIGVQMAPIGNTADAEPVDLVVMTHVLEHVTEPAAFLLESTQRLRLGGILFIEVPCRDWEHKPLDEPHLLFFDKGPMQRLLEQVGFDQIQVSYHGQKIEHLRRPSWIRRAWNGFRNRLIARGIIAPFSRSGPGLESLTALERATVRPFNAHLEMVQPAWWLRAVARKTNNSGRRLLPL
jgi:SAM-dependent methyltransferase